MSSHRFAGYFYSGRHRHGRRGLVHISILLIGAQHLAPRRLLRRPTRAGQPTRSAEVISLPGSGVLGPSARRAA